MSGTTNNVDITNFSEEMKQNARRTAEINRYYELKYAQYKKIAFEFAVGLVIIIAIIVLVFLIQTLGEL